MKNSHALAAVLAVCGNAAAQTTWYVDAAAAAPGLGTQISPYASIQYAHNQSTTHSFDTILVAPGVYDEHLLVTKRVTIRGSQGPLATAIKPTSNGTAVQLNGAIDQFAATVLDGFTIYTAGVNGATTVSANSGTMRDCIVLGNGHGTGAMTNYDFAIEDCLITGCEVGMQSAYVNFIYGKNNIVVGNSLYDVDVSNADFSSYSCYGTGSFSNTVGLVTADPLLRDPAGHDFHLLAGSPCIDAGDPGSPLDPDGSRADIGPLSFDAGYAAFAAYCTAKLNSLGCTLAISAGGTASFTANAPFTIACANELNHKLGLLFYGQSPLAAQYQGGWLCVASPVRRTPVVDSGGNAGPDDCSGSYTFEFNALIQSGADPALAPGAIVYAQFWSRDPNASYTTNRSDALRFGIAP
jgi:hypothetical protein